MAQLEDITVGCLATGLTGGKEPVTIVAIKWYGTGVLEVTFKDGKGSLGNRLVYRDEENRIDLLDKNLPWSFDADSDLHRLVSEAYRIDLAHIFDPYLAVHSSAIVPLPHQISAVYQEMLSRLPLRYIIADDPGAGKTIMTGLFLKELIVRGDLKRCLIVCPGSLAEQWQDELYRKFGLRFEILTNDRFESAVSGNVFTEVNYAIARLDKLARNEQIQKKLQATDWDLIVCDEAHKMSASIWGGEVKYTKRFQLGRLLSDITRHFLLLTATPHNGKEEDFQLFMSLIDPDRFGGISRIGKQATNISDVMRRLVKEELLKFDGTPLFPERIAYTVNYDLSPGEAELYTAVTNYVQEEFNRADQLNGERRNTVGFALTILQRRLASSPEAIYQSLRRRRERLESRLSEEELGKTDEGYLSPINLEDYDEDDWSSNELETAEETLADKATAALTITELRAEISTLQDLERMANNVRMRGEDRKWEELSGLLQDNSFMFEKDGSREKLIIFTEHRDTLSYLTDKIRSLLGSDEAVVNIHGSMPRDERRKVEESFKQDKDVRILVATDAAGEGINLQRAHLMVNYDLPWNPNRLEQRFGRIHRIGQTEVCHLWNLVSKETREGMVFQRLFEKLEQERDSLGGKVFDILGKVTFNNRSLRDLLIEAVRYGNDPEVRNRLNEIVDHSLNRQELESLLQEHALTDDIMDVHKVTAIREDMERMEAHKLQPHFIEAFFVEAFTSLGGTMKQREKGRYEITHVPFAIRTRDSLIGFGEPVLTRYERVCFDNEYMTAPGLIPAILISPGHPLLAATVDLIRERHVDTLKRGTIFIDENDDDKDIRLLFYIEDAIQDGAKRVISKQVHFVEMLEDGTALASGYAPYLDYSAPTEDELPEIHSYLSTQTWLKKDVEDMARAYAIGTIIPTHFKEVRSRKEHLTEKITKAVKERLTAAIQYWDYRAADLKQKEAAGKTNAKLNSQLAQRRAEELEGRLHKRLAELELEKQVSAIPPVIVGGALVIPRGLLQSLMGVSGEGTRPGVFTLGDKKATEIAAMKAVMELEASFGFAPRDVSMAKCGYDIESHIPPELRVESTASLRFIEVKGRVKGATSIIVTKNEILTALNKPNEFILAVVEVDGAETQTIYLKKPFENTPDFSSRCVVYDIEDLLKTAEIVYRQ